MTTARELELEQTVSRLEQENAALRALVQEQVQTIRTLTKRLADLEARLAKDSHNSSKPPSSDGYGKKESRSLRPTGKNLTGGQKGHPGHTLAMVLHPDAVAEYAVEHCQSCGVNLTQADVSPVIKRQVFDLPSQMIYVTEHQAHVTTCPGCGQKNTPSFPEHVKAPTQYGPVILALAAYLQYGQHLPYARVHTLLKEPFQVSLSEATIQAAVGACQQAIAPSLQPIEENLVDAYVTHHDETGLRVEGKLQWVHVMGTDTQTRLWVDPHRGAEGINALHLLDGRADKVIVHDYWSSYFGFPDVLHQLCNAHILRELIALTEKPFNQQWPKGMIQLLLEIKGVVDHADRCSLPHEQITAYTLRYADILERGFKENPERAQSDPKKRGRKKRTEAQNLLHRLRDHQDEHLRFMMDLRVPFDNNQAERDIRMVKLQQKISGSFRTMSGAKRFADIRSYVSTAHKHGLSVLKVIQQALLKEPWVPPNFVT